MILDKTIYSISVPMFNNNHEHTKKCFLLVSWYRTKLTFHQTALNPVRVYTVHANELLEQRNNTVSLASWSRVTNQTSKSVPGHTPP